MRAPVRGMQYYDYIIYYFRSSYVYSIVDLLKCGVLTLVDEIRRYRNDRYHHYYYYATSISAFLVHVIPVSPVL